MSPELTEREDITIQWLTTYFTNQGILDTERVEGIEWHSEIKVWTGTLYPFSIRYNRESPSAPKSLIFKHWHDTWKRTAIHDLYFSSDFAPQTPQVRVPKLYYANDRAERVCAIYEDFTPEYEIIDPFMKFDIVVIHRIIDTLATLHAHWWDSPQIDHDRMSRIYVGSLRFAHIASPEILKHYHQQIADLQTKHRSYFSESPNRWHEAFQWSVDNYARLLKKRSHQAKNVTLIHGDLHWENLAVKKSSSDVLLFDWETHKRGLGAYDIAYFLHAMIWGNDRTQYEESFLRDYYDRLVEHGVKTYSWDNLIQDYRLGVIMVLLGHLQWLEMGLRHNPKYIQDAVDGFYLWDCKPHLT